MIFSWIFMDSALFGHHVVNASDLEIKFIWSRDDVHILSDPMMQLTTCLPSPTSTPHSTFSVPCLECGKQYGSMCDHAMSSPHMEVVANQPGCRSRLGPWVWGVAATSMHQTMTGYPIPMLCPSPLKGCGHITTNWPRWNTHDPDKTTMMTMKWQWNNDNMTKKWQWWWLHKNDND